MNSEALTAETVAEYLKDHPDFLLQRQEILDVLSLSHQEQGAVSLVEIQMQRQRQRINELEEEITQLMSLAAKNDRIFYDMVALQQELLSCDSIDAIEHALSTYSDKQGLKCHLFLLGASQPAWQLSSDTHQRFLTNHLNGKPAYLGRLNQQDRCALFGNPSFAHKALSELGSYVILPLTQKKPIGLMVFSSQDGGYFQPNMDTLFLQHLSALVSFMVNHLGYDDEQQSSKVFHYSDDR